MKTYLITGGCGFIGSNYILKMVQNPDNYIINLDNLTYASNKNYLRNIEKYKNYKFIKGDICNQKVVEKIFKKYNIDYLINFAAESHVDRSYLDPSLFVKTNVLGVVNLLNICKNHWKDYSCHRFIQISTDEVYGSSVTNTNKKQNKVSTEFYECDKLNPSSPYSSSKASAELIALSYFKCYNFPVIITRSSNNFGINQHPEKLIPKTFLSCIQNQKINVYGSGKQKRDWLSVNDNINAINLILEKGKIGEIYNISAKNPIENIEVIKKIIKYTQKNKLSKVTMKNITHVADRIAHDFEYNINNEKIKQLGFVTNNNFDEELFKTLDYYKNNINLLLDAKN